VAVDWCDAVRPWPVIRAVGIAPPPDVAGRAKFEETFGRGRAVYLVRPDGYVAFAGGKHASAADLDAYCRRWLTAQEAARAPERRAA
jgi:hypothetical protein